MCSSRKCFIIALVSVFAYSAACSQQRDTVKRNISISLGATHYRLVDEAFSLERTKYRGNPFHTVIAWQRSTPRHLFDGTVQIAYGNVSPLTERPDAVFFNIQCSASYARYAFKYSLFKTSNMLYAGGRFRSSNHALVDEKYLEEIVVSAFHTLDVFVHQHTSLSGRSDLQFSLSFPVVGLLKRTAYEGGANQEMERQYRESPLTLFFKQAKPRVFNPLLFPQFSIIYTYSLTSKTDLMLSYQFSFVKNNEIATVSMYGNALSAGFRFNFNKPSR